MYTTIIYTSYDNDLDYTLALFHYTESLYIQTISVHSLSMDTTRVIWQQRLFHIHTKGIGVTSKVFNSIPPFSSDNDLDSCGLCFTLKMRITVSEHGNTRRYAMKLNQVISLDWGFMMQKCNDKEMTDRLTGMNRDQA